MKTADVIKKEWPVLVLVLGAFICSFLIWDQIPDTVPTHYNLQGKADDYGPKWILLIMLPALALVLYASLLFLPYIDPKKRIDVNQKPISGIRVIITVFMIGLYGITLLEPMGIGIEINSIMPIAIGLLFIVMGNYMNSIKSNYFIGIRTPWTLENERVWKKTHRMGSKLWMLGGAVLIIGSILLNQRPILGTTLIGITIFPLAVIPVLYSYIIFKKLENSDA